VKFQPPRERLQQGRKWGIYGGKKTMNDESQMSNDEVSDEGGTFREEVRMTPTAKRIARPIWPDT
jgi:hypothetical protein